MPRRFQKSRRIGRRELWRRRLLTPGLIAAAACAQAVIYSLLATHPAPPANTYTGSRVAPETEILARAAFPERLARPVYRYSVIRGGAYNAEELRQALDSDPVAARHYASFVRAQVRTEPSRFLAPVYVSYRVGDDIYWTRRPVALGAGETLLTDGVNCARARCGNRVSVTPQLPVAAAGPEPGALEAVEAPAPEEAIPRWHEVMLAAEVFPAFLPETPAQKAAMLPALVGQSEEGLGFRFPAFSEGLIPFQAPGGGTTAAARPSLADMPVQSPAIPELPLDDPGAPGECCSIAMLSLTPAGWPLSLSLSTPPLAAWYAPPGFSGQFPDGPPPGAPPELAPEFPPGAQPETSSASGGDAPGYTAQGFAPQSPSGPPPVAPIPEPGSLWLALSALGLAAAASRALRMWR